MLLPRLASGHFDPVYAYAGDNPVSSSDPSGLVGDGTNDVQQVRTMADGTSAIMQDCKNGDQSACTVEKGQTAIAVALPLVLSGVGVAIAAPATAPVVGGVAGNPTVQQKAEDLLQAASSSTSGVNLAKQLASQA
jgi:hypothetical protein